MSMDEFEREFEKFRKCMSEECFRWAIAVCMGIKREYWNCFGACLGEHETKPELTEDKCHELCMDEVLRKNNFTKNAIKECLIS